MIRLLRLILILASLLTLLVAGVRQFGSAQPSDRLAYRGLFHNADGSRCVQPCLFGLTLDDADFAAALERLRAHPGTLRLDWQTFSDPLALIGSSDVNITLSGTGTLVMLVTIREEITLSTVFATFGAPRWVYVDPRRSGTTVWLLYDDKRFTAEVQKVRRLRPDEPIRRFSMAANGFFAGGDEVPWRGFTWLSRYQP